MMASVPAAYKRPRSLKLSERHPSLNGRFILDSSGFRRESAFVESGSSLILFSKTGLIYDE
jgi:hypothetical protein